MNGWGAGERTGLPLGELDQTYKDRVRAIEELRSGNQAVRKYESDRKTLAKLEEERDCLKEQKKELARAYGRLPARREKLEGKKADLRVLEEQKRGLPHGRPHGDSWLNGRKSI